MPANDVVAMLPDIANLIRISKAIAMLDAILCEEWEMRYYSFNSNWDKTDPTQMMHLDACAQQISYHRA